MDKDAKNKLAHKVLKEDDLRFDVNIDGEVFVMKYPLPFENGLIQGEVARRLGGFPRTSFSEEHVAMTEAYCYVEAMVIHEDSPSWFTSAWACPDDDVVLKLYQGYLQFRSKLQGQLRGD